MANNIVSFQLVAHSVAHFAVSFEGFPKRTVLDAASAPSAYDQQTKYHGSKLII